MKAKIQSVGQSAPGRDRDTGTRPNGTTAIRSRVGSEARPPHIHRRRRRGSGREGPPPPPPQARAGSGPSRPRSRRRGPGPCRPGLVGPPGLILPVTQFSWARSLVLKYLGRPGRAGDSASAKSGQPGPGHHISLLESAIFVLAGDAPAAVSAARGPGPGRLGRAASAAGWFRPGLVGPPGGELARSH